MKKCFVDKFRGQELNERGFTDLHDFIIKTYSLSSDSLYLIRSYLEKRRKEVHGKESFGIVYVLTKTCNLNCFHCGVNAGLKKLSKGSIVDEITFSQAKIIIDKVSLYTKEKNYRPFLMFGGGEPTLLKDFPLIVRYASEQIGNENIGFCTNGTTLTVSDLLRLGQYVSLIETSIDGMEAEHNAMRDPRLLTSINPFKTTHYLVKESLNYPELRDKLEVSATVTKKNWRSIPSLARFLREAGLGHFSVHRAMPVGRMAINSRYILSKEEYIDFFLEMAKVKEEDSEFKVHIHHSLESIYSTLFLGKDIHHADLPMGSGRHSIGIDWQGFVFFDAWSVVSPFKLLRSYNLLGDGMTLADILDSPNSLVGLVNEMTKRNLRCKQCKFPCGGGMRFNALFDYASKVKTDIQDSHLLAGLSEIDPACLVS